MPNKVVTFRRWEVIVAFVVLTISFTVMGVILHKEINRNTNAIKLIQASRVEACQQNYKDIRDVLTLFLLDNRQDKSSSITKEFKLLIKHHFDQLDPDKCYRIIKVRNVDLPLAIK